MAELHKLRIALVQTLAATVPYCASIIFTLKADHPESYLWRLKQTTRHDGDGIKIVRPVLPLIRRN
eukprot:SAG11_NODE_2876_length_2880_cov_1.317512_4_plen_66_part_00